MLIQLFALTLTMIRSCNLWSARDEALAITTTLRVATKASHDKIKQSSSFWKGWHDVFHLVMISTYITCIVRKRIVSELRIAMLVAIDLTPLQASLIYTWCIIYQLHRIFIASAVELVMRASSVKTTNSKRRSNRYEIACSALPEHLMVLSLIRLRTWFVRIIETLGFAFLRGVHAFHANVSTAAWETKLDCRASRRTCLNRFSKGLLLAMIMKVVLLRSLLVAAKCQINWLTPPGCLEKIIFQ